MYSPNYREYHKYMFDYPYSHFMPVERKMVNWLPNLDYRLAMNLIGLPLIAGHILKKHFQLREKEFMKMETIRKNEQAAEARKKAAEAMKKAEQAKKIREEKELEEVLAREQARLPPVYEKDILEHHISKNEQLLDFEPLSNSRLVLPTRKHVSTIYEKNSEIIRKSIDKKGYEETMADPEMKKNPMYKLFTVKGLQDAYLDPLRSIPKNVIDITSDRVRSVLNKQKNIDVIDNYKYKQKYPITIEKMHIPSNEQITMEIYFNKYANKFINEHPELDEHIAINESIQSFNRISPYKIRITNID